MPVISVILLAHNSGVFLRPAVDSILDQTMGDLELIIVDNGSTDGAVQQVLASRPDARLRLLRHETNLGIGGGTASAVPLCNAPWIAIMDSDDRSHPMRFELQMKAAAADPSLDLISTNVVVVNEGDLPSGNWPAFYTPEEMKGYAAYNMPFCHPTMIARAAVLRSIPYRAEFKIAADFDFVARATEQYKIGAVSLPLYYYRRHSGSTSIRQIVLSEMYAGVIRLTTARRRAGRPEQLASEVASAAEHLGSSTALRGVYARCARRCFEEGFHLLAVFHAALECREHWSLRATVRYLRYLAAAIVADRGSWRAALAAAGKGPYWALLKRAGFPAFPRY